MAKKEKTPKHKENQNPGSYYKINKDAVERLVNASKETAPKVSDEEIAKISGRKKKFQIPEIVKVLFIKWWFNGAICFFFFFGLGTTITNQIDMLFVLGAALGGLTDLLTNNVLKFFEKSERSNDKYMFITIRKFWSLILNVLYGYFILYVVVYIYNLINIVLNQIEGTQTQMYLAVEPIGFGLACLLVDMICILIKNTFKKIIDDAKANNRR